MFKINKSLLNYLHNLLPQRLLNHCNRFAGEVVATTQPARNVRWSAEGEFGKLFFADALFFHYGINTTCYTLCNRVSFPVKNGDAVVSLLNDWAVNPYIIIWYHNSKEALVHELFHEFFIFAQVVAVKADGVESNFVALFDGLDGGCFHRMVF